MELQLFHFDHILLLLLLFYVSFQLRLSVASDSIFPGQRLAGNLTLTSVGGVFEMGFFAPQGNSHNYYIGIWHKLPPKQEKIVVRVANRENPVSDPYSSWLELGEDGHLGLLISSNIAVWSTNSTTSRASPSNSTVGTLGNDGNFITREKSMETQIWQSIDHPTDTWLPGAKIGYDNHTGVKTILTSWKDTNNPAPGLHSTEVLEVNQYCSEVQMLLKNGLDEFKFCFYEDDIDFGFTIGRGSIDYSDSHIVIVYPSYPTCCLLRYVLNVTGQPQLHVWFSNVWYLMTTLLETCYPHIPKTKEEERVNKNDDIRRKEEESGNKNATWIWIATVASALLALLFIGITVLLRVKRRKNSGNSFEATGDTLNQYKRRDLQRATKNCTQKLGEGGFSTVYKGEFPKSTFLALKEC